MVTFITVSDIILSFICVMAYIILVIGLLCGIILSKKGAKKVGNIISVVTIILIVLLTLCLLIF